MFIEKANIKVVVSSSRNEQRILTNKHKAEDSNGDYLFMTDVGNPLFYVAQSGLLAEGLPTHKSNYIANKKSYQMDSESLIIPLIYETP